ncbi:MAG: EamA family transporter [Bacteroidia bacterium]|nr:EamA family transporter [Bacteroidia bacterium]
MWYVIGCIATNVLLLIWLRILRMPLLTLITLNYLVCVGWVFVLEPPSWGAVIDMSGLGLVALGVLGVLFISVFGLTGYVSRSLGVGLAGMLAKLSLVLPIGFAAMFLDEPLSLFQQAALLTGTGAIVVVHFPYLRAGRWRPLLQGISPGFLLWLSNGVIDILFKAALPLWKTLSPLHIPFWIMGLAGIIGLLTHFFQRRAPLLLQPRLWLGALLLGTTNLLSLYFYLKGLETLPAAQFFLWNNIGVILVAGVVGTLLFQEPLTWAGIIGYGLGVVSILLSSLK